jgi:phage baseplate assembly protein W
MRSISWPEMFTKTSTNISSDKDATNQNLKILLQTDSGELFGDPEFGANLTQFLYDPNDSILLDLLKDAIYTAIATYMPQLMVNRSDISLKSDKRIVYIEITALNKINYQTDLYNITLTSSMISGE